jgi:hypothetical protein
MYQRNRIPAGLLLVRMELPLDGYWYWLVGSHNNQLIHSNVRCSRREVKINLAVALP